MKPLLQVQNLCVSFTHDVVHNLSFELYEGETLGIVGESGSGKSMMAKSLLQLTPAKSTGHIYFEEQDLLLLSEKEMNQIRGKKIGMIFQDPMSSLNPTMKIGKQIVEGFLHHYPHISSKEGRELALKLLNLVGIQDPLSKIDAYPHTLSGGMRQRVMIALALACDPRIIIADEITTALDVTIQAMILNLLKDLQQKLGMSIIMISHNLSVLASFCDRIIVMYAGEIVEVASVEDLFYSPKHPYTQELLRAIPRIDMPKDKPLILTRHIGEAPSKQGCPFNHRCPFAMEICTQKKPPSVPLENTQTARCWLLQKEECYVKTP